LEQIPELGYNLVSMTYFGHIFNEVPLGIFNELKLKDV
jgi:hypothetical protein